MLAGPFVNAADGDERLADTTTWRRWRIRWLPGSQIAGDKPIRWIINTHVHGSHRRQRRGGRRELDHRRELRQAGQAAANFAQIIAHENTGNLIRAEPPPNAGHAGRDVLRRPARLFFQRRGSSFTPNAHTDGDVIFRKSDAGGGEDGGIDLP